MIWDTLVAVLIIACIINYAVDFAFYLKNRYCRFHIGRWKQADWEEAVEKTARKWVKHTPTVKVTDNTRYILLDFFQGKYRSGSIQSWQRAALILGLWESKNTDSMTKARKAALNLLDKNGDWRDLPVAVDCGMLAYAILKAVDDPRAVRPAMDFTKKLIEDSMNDEGMISYTGGAHNPEMYVDTIGLTCPFLALYAKTYGDSVCEEMAFHQLVMYYKYGLLNKTMLPNHAFHVKTKLPLGVYGWGRGTAWYVIGLMDTYFELQSSQYRATVYQWITEAAEAYTFYQRADGGFGSILQREGTYDSSATAALAWFYAECGVLLDREEYHEVSRRCLKKLLEKTRITGAIDECQGDTKGIGVFAQTYDVMPFAQGMALRAINIEKDRK